VEHDVTWSDVGDGEAHGQCPEAAGVCAVERRVLVEHGSVEMDADIGSHPSRTVAQHLNNNVKIIIYNLPFSCRFQKTNAVIELF